MQLLSETAAGRKHHRGNPDARMLLIAMRSITLSLASLLQGRKMRYFLRDFEVKSPSNSYAEPRSSLAHGEDFFSASIR
jgi:hypothetical protein